MDFGKAIVAVKQGKKIQREGWNGKDQYVELATCISYKNAAGKVVNVWQQGACFCGNFRRSDRLAGFPG